MCYIFFFFLNKSLFSVYHLLKKHFWGFEFIFKCFYTECLYTDYLYAACSLSLFSTTKIISRWTQDLELAFALTFWSLQQNWLLSWIQLQNLNKHLLSMYFSISLKIAFLCFFKIFHCAIICWSDKYLLDFCCSYFP